MPRYINRHKRTLTFYAVLFVMGLLLYAAAHDYATQMRGYVAYGGECMFLGLPLFGLIAKAIIGDLIQGTRKERTE